MPLMTQLLDQNGQERAIPWAWEDRMILALFVLADGGQVGEATDLRAGGLLNFGYVGAGCAHTFAQPFGYCQVDTREEILVAVGDGYREFRS